MEERILDIETKIAFQENMIKELSDIIFEQHKKIDLLEEKIDLFSEKIRNISGQGENIRDEKPPHY